MKFVSVLTTYPVTLEYILRRRDDPGCSTFLTRVRIWIGNQSERGEVLCRHREQMPPKRLELDFI
jgi:hypothetical protein